MSGTRIDNDCFLHGGFEGMYCPECRKMRDKCANCDHSRVHHSGTFPEIVCVGEGTDPDHYCTCDQFEEPAAPSEEAGE